MNPIYIALLLPFAGTALGSSFVFLLKDKIQTLLQKALLGFASGVMVAASIWSLLIPAMNMCESSGKWAVMPALIGFLCGIAFLLLMDRIIPHLHLNSSTPEGPRSKLSRTSMLTLAVTLHNLPEGMAVGVVLAGALEGSVEISSAGVIALAAGIAIQNIPEGAIISTPLRAENYSKSHAFFLGALSGIVEPIGAILTLLLAAYVVPILPYLLAFSAGSMMYVVVEELIPESAAGKHSNIGTIGFAIGFSIMMVLDVVLG